jgi:hypothetical protein
VILIRITVDGRFVNSLPCPWSTELSLCHRRYERPPQKYAANILGCADEPCFSHAFFVSLHPDNNLNTSFQPQAVAEQWHLGAWFGLISGDL